MIMRHLRDSHDDVTDGSIELHNAFDSNVRLVKVLACPSTQRSVTYFQGYFDLIPTEGMSSDHMSCAATLFRPSFTKAIEAFRKKTPHTYAYDVHISKSYVGSFVIARYELESAGCSHAGIAIEILSLCSISGMEPDIVRVLGRLASADMTDGAPCVLFSQQSLPKMRPGPVADALVEQSCALRNTEVWIDCTPRFVDCMDM